MSPSPEHPESSEGRLSIGALARATGIPVETLRTWEARYGFPAPERKPSGHRLYPLSSVPRLRRIAEALTRGHRAGEVVPASDQVLDDLLRATPAPASPPGVAREPAGHLDLMRVITDFDGPALTHILLQDWARLGPLGFLEDRVIPAVRDIGEAWKDGRLEIRHEHFFSERAGDLLRSLRIPFEERATGPLVILSTLPGEAHGLGLQMAALVLAVSGCRILFLGTEVPATEIATLARDTNARAVAVSVSKATRGPASANQIGHLRRLLPRRVSVIVGGDGAPRPHAGIEVLQDLAALEAWGRRIAAAL